MNLQSYLLPCIVAAVEAGIATLDVYHQDFEVEEKSDKSPLTLADKRAHEIITSHLSRFDIPILSEEGKTIDYARRKEWEYLWIVDPLDGTKEFVKRNDEFTINIALVHKQMPILGVVYVPVLHRLYFAAKDFGAYRVGVEDFSEIKVESIDQIVKQSVTIDIKPKRARPYTIVGSRSHATPELEAYVAKKREEHGTVEFIAAGSSLKICQVAEGNADVYPRLGPTMEWDTAAGHVIAECAGALVFQSDNGEPLVYNKENLLNPWFIVSNGKH
ncbi:MAG: 3'(2'),5'-bisphosphate nucleotidase CysQ [Dissulfuribacterales bacterium]